MSEADTTTGDRPADDLDDTCSCGQCDRLSARIAELESLAYHYSPSEPFNPDGVTWRQMYEALDEKSLGDRHGHDCAIAALAEERQRLDDRIAALEASNARLRERCGRLANECFWARSLCDIKDFDRKHNEMIRARVQVDLHDDLSERNEQEPTDVG